MKAQIVKQTLNRMLISWEDPIKGFGKVSIKYDKQGRYIIDTEYLSIETLLKIIFALNE